MSSALIYFAVVAAICFYFELGLTLSRLVVGFVETTLEEDNAGACYVHLWRTNRLYRAYVVFAMPIVFPIAVVILFINRVHRVFFR